MRLFFQGELPTIAVVLIAILVAIAVGWYYSRETRSLDLPHRWLLPMLRGLAIVLVILMLAGPTIEYRRERGTIATVNVFVDVSDSMKFSDALDNDSGATSSNAESTSPADDQVTKKGPTRIDRAAALLLGDKLNPGWLQAVKETHRVKLFLLGGDRAEKVYDSEAPEPAPRSIGIVDAKLDPSRTNLGQSISDRLLGASIESVAAKTTAESKEKGNAQAVVVLSDGQHNSGESPEDIARRLGDLSIPVFTIGFGRQTEPIDLAILDIDAPPLVAAKGRAAGTLSIKDLGNIGDRYRVRILSGDKTVWERTLTTENQANRRLAFDFPVAELVAEQRAKQSTLERTKVAIPLHVVLEAVTGEYDQSNNAIDYRLSASTRTRRMLIVDSRSRWETRYIRNVFDRDPTWEVETIILWPDRTTLTALDEPQVEFPKDQKALAAFDVILWGDVDSRTVSNDQLALVRDFVSQGGGLVFIDGDRDQLSMMAESPIGDLVPVKFVANQRISSKMRLTPTPSGAERAAMSLLPGGDASATDNETAWAELQAPTSLRQVETLPGADVWLEAKVDALERPVPVLVTRLFGGGQVVYLATDQTWRWRYRVADLYHARFWNQLVEAIMQPPFDVRDQYMALSTGAAQYRAGERAAIRVQLRNAEGNPETDAVVDAVLKRDGAADSVVPLRLVDASRGIYQGESEPLEQGDYTTSVRAAGYSASAAVTSSFLVSPPPNRENLRLAQNVALLSVMADGSRGVYADALQAQRVWDAIKPLSDGKIEVKKLALAQSYIWFVAILALLAMEWWLRKKVGLV